MKFFKKIMLVFCVMVAFLSVEVTHAAELLSLKRCSNLKIINAQKNEDITISSDVFGGKSSGLALLQKNGYQIPTTIFIEATSDLSLIDSNDFKNSLYKAIEPLAHGGYYNVAIRSSCTDEDTSEDSMAGQFDTIIGKCHLEKYYTMSKKLYLNCQKQEIKKEKWE